MYWSIGLCFLTEFPKGGYGCRKIGDAVDLGTSILHLFSMFCETHFNYKRRIYPKRQQVIGVHFKSEAVKIGSLPFQKEYPYLNEEAFGKGYYEEDLIARRKWRIFIEIGGPTSNRR